MTPSGFNIGIILNTKLSLKYFAPSSSLTKYSKVPYIIMLAFDSPGCTLDVKITALLNAISSGLAAKLVTITISQLLPAMVLVKVVFLILSFV
jgi:hypothetical protein